MLLNTDAVCLLCFSFLEEDLNIFCLSKILCFNIKKFTSWIQKLRKWLKKINHLDFLEDGVLNLPEEKEKNKSKKRKSRNEWNKNVNRINVSNKIFCLLLLVDKTLWTIISYISNKYIQIYIYIWKKVNGWNIYIWYSWWYIYLFIFAEMFQL